MLFRSPLITLGEYTLDTRTFKVTTPRGEIQLTPVQYDLLYHLMSHPGQVFSPTRLLQEASARGCRGVDGLEMLVQQGAAALRLWCGREEVPVATMRQALLERLP